MSDADFIRNRVVQDMQRELIERARKCDDMFALSAAIDAMTPTSEKKEQPQ